MSKSLMIKLMALFWLFNSGKYYEPPTLEIGKEVNALRKTDSILTLQFTLSPPFSTCSLK